jgi:hypothetical protein
VPTLKTGANQNLSDASDGPSCAWQMQQPSSIRKVQNARCNPQTAMIREQPPTPPTALFAPPIVSRETFFLKKDCFALAKLQNFS